MWSRAAANPHLASEVGEIGFPALPMLLDKGITDSGVLHARPSLAALCSFTSWAPARACSPQGFAPALSAQELWLSRTVLCWGSPPHSDHLLHVPGVPFSIAQRYYCLKHSHRIMDYWNALFGLSGLHWLWKTHSFTECLPECLKFDGSVPLRT